MVRTLAERLAGQVAVAQINTQENPTLAARFGVNGIPVTKLLRHGREAASLAGAQSVANVISWYLRQKR